jgi:amidase
MNELHQLSALEIGAWITGGRISSTEVTRHILERIEHIDAGLHSFSHVDPQLALQQALDADDERQSGSVKGPLHGVPYAVKELIAARGMPNGIGMGAAGSAIAADDARIVARLRDAGAVLLGKLTMTEGAWTTHHAMVTPPVNPWGANLATGGSSSGAGVAVAAGLCFFAIGTDTGGSIRHPASATGCFALKPTWGAIDAHGVASMSATLDHLGLIARCGADLQAVFDVAASHGTARKMRAPEPDAHDLARLRIAISAGGERCSEANRSALGAFSHWWGRQGGRTLEVDLPDLDCAARTWVDLCASDVALRHEYAHFLNPGSFGAALAALIVHGHSLSRVHLHASQKDREEFTARVDALFSGFDLLVLPVHAHGPVNRSYNAQRTDSPHEMIPALACTAPFNLSGHPALVVPGPSAGAPVGIQMVARHGAESLLFRVAQAYEIDFPWRQPSAIEGQVPGRAIPNFQPSGA